MILEASVPNQVAHYFGWPSNEAVVRVGAHGSENHLPINQAAKGKKEWSRVPQSPSSDIKDFPVGPTSYKFHHFPVLPPLGTKPLTYELWKALSQTIAHTLHTLPEIYGDLFYSPVCGLSLGMFLCS